MDKISLLHFNFEFVLIARRNKDLETSFKVIGEYRSCQKCMYKKFPILLTIYILSYLRSNGSFFIEYAYLISILCQKRPEKSFYNIDDLAYCFVLFFATRVCKFQFLVPFWALDPSINSFFMETIEVMGPIVMFIFEIQRK